MIIIMVYKVLKNLRDNNTIRADYWFFSCKFLRKQTLNLPFNEVILICHLILYKSNTVNFH